MRGDLKVLTTLAHECAASPCNDTLAHAVLMPVLMAGLMHEAGSYHVPFTFPHHELQQHFQLIPQALPQFMPQL